MVRLQRYRDPASLCCVCPFNPTMVRLQRRSGERIPPHSQTFNPTMVRLQPARKDNNMRHRVYFQSHYGAIATQLMVDQSVLDDLLSIPLWCDCNSGGLNAPMTRVSFQSHYGAIATERTFHNVRLLPPFNPTMVRLQLRWFCCFLSLGFAFNPTMVRLQPLLPSASWLHALAFNPTMVRLQQARTRWRWQVG